MEFKSTINPTKSPRISPLRKKILILNNDIKRIPEDKRPMSHRVDRENNNYNTIEDFNSQIGIPNTCKNMSTTLTSKDQNNFIYLQKNKLEYQPKSKTNKSSKNITFNNNPYIDINSDIPKRDDINGLSKEREKEKEKERDKNNDKDLYIKSVKIQNEKSKKFLREIGDSNFLPQLSTLDNDFDANNGISSNSLEFVALDIESTQNKNKDKNSYYMINLLSDIPNNKTNSKLPSIVNKNNANGNTNNVQNLTKTGSLAFDNNLKNSIKKKVVRNGAKYLSDFQLTPDALESNPNKFTSLSPAGGKILNNQLASVIPTVQGSTFKLHKKNKVNNGESKIKDPTSGMNAIEYENSSNIRKEEEIIELVARSIFNKKSTPLNLDGRIQSVEDEKNTTFSIATTQNGYQDVRNPKKSITQNPSSQKINMAPINIQSNANETPKDNENTEIISSPGLEKDNATPRKVLSKGASNSNNNISYSSNVNLTKPTNLPNMKVLVKKGSLSANSGQNKSCTDQKVKDLDPLFASKYAAYRDWMLKINFSFNVIVKQPCPSNFISYKFFIGKGNNKLLIKTLMKQRWWWVPAESQSDPNINFLWTQLKQNPFLELLKQRKKNAYDNSIDVSTTIIDTQSEKNNGSATDQSDSDYEISLKKSNKIINKNTNNNSNNANLSTLKKSKSKKSNCDKDINNLHNRIMNKIDTLQMLNYLENKRKINYLEDEEELIKINRKNQQSYSLIIDQPNNIKMHNHIENNFHLSNKKAMFYNMRNYFDALKKNVFDHLPLTFHIQNGLDDIEYKKFLDYYQSREKEIQEQEELNKNNTDKKALAMNKKISKNIWIIKPGENTNRGNGITVCNELNQIKEIISSNEIHPNGKKKTYIVQQYLDKPLLYNKRKFDIRCYMMITSINGLIRGYWYQDGYIRTASKEFTLKNVTNRMIHLTNDAVQKKCEEYGKFENGNKLSYAEFQRYLDHAYSDANINFMNDIYPQMKNLATDAIRSVYGKVDPFKREHTFEVFGLDFMIDQNFKVWLIEINTNPCLELSSPHLARVIPTMVENALRISLDPMFPPPNWPTSKKHLLPDNPLENNKFEIIFDELEDSPSLKILCQENNQQLMDQIYEMEEEEEEDSGDDEKEDNQV